jgi:hypothetical protein
MKNITKKVVVLFSSLFLSVSAYAGELTVTGSANASYVVNGGSVNNNDKGLGISNELKFAASGELDNGFTWDYFMELDGNDGGAHDNDDSQLKIGMGGMGTLYINDSEGGLSTETGDGIGAVGVGSDFANTADFVGNAIDVSGSGNIQYDAPADVLPFGIGVSVAYVPNNSDTDNNSYKNSGTENTAGGTGDSTWAYRVKAAPIDGLSIGADYVTASGTTGTNAQTQESGGYYAAYQMGNFEIGYKERYHAPAVASKTTANTAHSYVLTGIGVEIAVNDALSISYSEEESTRKRYTATTNAAAGASPFTRDEVSFESTFLMLAYDIGGATVGITNIESSNSGYTAGADTTKTLATMSMAF